MRKTLSAFALFVAVLAVGATAARAQNFTTVSGTITDPNGIPYSYGTVNAILVPGSSGSYTLNGQTYGGFLAPTSLDVNGHFSASMGSNAVILPGSSQWKFTINEAGIQPPLGTGNQNFTATITISGATQNISSTLNALAPALTNFAGGSGGTAGPYTFFGNNTGSSAAGAFVTFPGTSTCVFFNVGGALGCVTADMFFNSTTGHLTVAGSQPGFILASGSQFVEAGGLQIDAAVGDDMYFGIASVAQFGRFWGNTSAHPGEFDLSSGSPAGSILLNEAGQSSGVTAGQLILNGSGSPAGVVTALVGSLYLRNDGGSSTTLYVKETGTGNTGWVAK